MSLLSGLMRGGAAASVAALLRGRPLCPVRLMSAASTASNTTAPYFHEPPRGTGHDPAAASRYGHDNIVLGIESTFDDTGVCIMDMRGNVLGEELISQRKQHVNSGGIIPPVAKQLHDRNLPLALSSALSQSSLSLDDISTIAVAVGPGLAPCLGAGLEFAKGISHKHAIPAIGIHHMEAHALTPRISHTIEFPYLVLLVSGGHSLVLLARGVNDFTRLGTALDDSPGDAYEKVARSLGLSNGGSELELYARYGDESKYPFSLPLQHSLSCNTSFSGLRTATERVVEQLRTANAVVDSEYAPSSPPLISNPECRMDSLGLQDKRDVAASFQSTAIRHLTAVTHRAIRYCESKNIALSGCVVSGGVACNAYLREKLSVLCAYHGISAHFPSPMLCTDNGRMIAWTGVEYLKAGFLPITDISHWKYKPQWPLGVDDSEGVERAQLRSPRLFQALKRFEQREPQEPSPTTH